MSNQNRRQYLTTTVLTQDFLDACHDNLENRLEMVCEIETPTGTIYASDRNKYVGGTFYEALLNFPVISRTVGEWLSSDLQFSTLTLELSNVDGRFNNYLQAGDDFGGWIGREVNVKVGVSEESATYTTIFSGHVTDIGGLKRSTKAITVIARDDYDRVNISFPNVAFKEDDFPKIEDKNVGKIIPYILGDWTRDLEPSPSAVPAYVVNGKDPLVDFKDRPVDITIASPAVLSSDDHNFDEGDPIELTTNGTLPTGLATATTYYIKSPGPNSFNLSAAPFGAAINTSGAQTGQHRVAALAAAARRNLQFRISVNVNRVFDSERVYLKRGDLWSIVPTSEIMNINADKNEFEVKNKSGILWVNNGTALVEYEFDAGDEFLVQVEGKDLSGFNDNIVEQARDILITYGGLTSGEFDANWNTFRSKASPAQSAISTFRSRVWIQEPQTAMNYALSLLEQVRLEAFIDRNLKVKINSLHFEDWSASPTHVVRNWDIEENSFKTSIDEKNNFNRAQGNFNFLPDRNENARATEIHRNAAAIIQAGKPISKKIVFPNLYELAVVTTQVIEILRLASSSLEILDGSLTWRALLRDIGDFTMVDIQIGSAIFESVPCMIREIGYDPAGLKIPVKVWSTQMTPFPGYVPAYSGIVGGYNAVIITE